MKAYAKTLLGVVLAMAAVVGLFCGPAVSGEYHESGYYWHHGKMKGDYDPKKSFEEFSKKLNLSKEQQEKIRPILNREVDEIKKVYAEAWEKEKRILDQHNQKVMDLLTPQQKEKYRKLQQERKGMKEGKMKDHHQMKQGEKSSGRKTAGQAGDKADTPVIVTIVVAEPVNYYGKSVVAEGYVKRALTKDAFILSEAPHGQAEIVVVGAGPAVVQGIRGGERVAVRGVVQNFKIDNIENALGVDLDEGVFGILENKPGIFARWVEKL